MKVNSVSKDINKMFTKKEIVIHSEVTNKDYKVIIDNKLKKSKIIKMFNAMGERSEVCLKSGVIFDFVLCQWCMFLSQFSNLEFDTGETLLETYVKELKGVEHLIDAGILDKINSAFDEEEVKKVSEIGIHLGKYTSRMHEIEIGQIVNDIVGDGFDEV